MKIAFIPLWALVPPILDSSYGFGSESPPHVLFAWFLIFIFTYLFGCAGSQLLLARSFSRGMQTLSCGMRDLVPRPRIKPGPPALEILATRPPGKSHPFSFLIFLYTKYFLLKYNLWFLSPDRTPTGRFLLNLIFPHCVPSEWFSRYNYYISYC